MFILTKEKSNILLEKAKKYVNLLDEIPEELWNYILQNITEQYYNLFIQEEDKYCHFQIPVTTFGIFVHNNAYEFLLEKIKNRIFKDYYILDSFTPEQVFKFVNHSKIGLKAFINFIYKDNYKNEVKNEVKSKLVILTKLNGNVKIETKIKQKIKIIDEFREVKCCFSHKDCISFRNSCLLGHYLCATEYINSGCIFTNKEMVASFFSNNKEHLKRMINLGMRISKTALSITINYNLNESFNFLLENQLVLTDENLFNTLINNIFVYWNTKHCNILNYLKYLDILVLDYPKVFDKINKVLTIGFFKNLEFDSKQFPNLYKIKMFYMDEFDKEIKRIENHLYFLFNTPGYYNSKDLQSLQPSF